MAGVSNEKMRAAVCCAIIELEEPPSLEAVRRHLFGTLTLDADSEDQLRVAHSSQLRIAQLEHCKNAMAIAIERDPAAAEERFRSSMSQDAFNSDPEAHRLVSALDSDSAEAATLFKELEQYRWKLACRSQTEQAEPAFRRALKRWLASGEPTQDMWEAMCRWRAEGGGLNAFREHVQAAVAQLQEIQSQSLIRRMLAAARRLGEFAEFAEIEKIRRLLNQCCAPSLTLKEGGHLRVEGAIVSASLLLSANTHAVTEDFFIAVLLDTQEVPRTISIYATECFSLDASLDQPLWAGVNLCIVTKRLYIHNHVVIDLSGRSFDARPESDRTARSADSPDGPGLTGKEGRAGQSSGNLLILASKVIGEDRLSVRLNGGRGEDGQHGGDGCKGLDGVGVTDDEIRAMDFPGLERSPDEQMELEHYFFSPLSSAKQYDFVDNSGRFISHRRSDTRSLTCVTGTRGGEGSWGGAGGQGGEGGRPGVIKMSNLTETRDWLPGSVTQRSGENGNDGNDGEQGARGCDATDAYCYKDFSLDEWVVRHSSSGKKLKIGWTEGSRFNAPPHYLTIPYFYEFSLLTKTYAVFEEFELERPPQQPQPVFWRAGRLQAQENATLSSSIALNRFAQVSRSSINKSDERARVKHIGAMQAEVSKNTMHADVVRMVRNKQIYADCSLLSQEDSQSINDVIESRSNLMCRPSNIWTTVKEFVHVPTRSDFDSPREAEYTVDFEEAFTKMQNAVLELNAELVTELEDFTKCQPPTAIAREKIARAFESNRPLQECVDFLLTSMNSSTFVHTLGRLVDAVDPKRFPLTWRTIIDISWSIDTRSNCNWNFVSLLIATTPLNELLDVMITLRIALSTRRIELLHSMRLRDALRLIKSTEAKWLIHLKLEEAEMKSRILDKVEDTIDLLCHAQDQLRQLADLPIEEWVVTAGRQNWTVVDREHFGSAVFYLEMMSRAGFGLEERAMRVILREGRRHSPMLFGEVACFIASKEVVADDRFFGALLLRVLADDTDDADILELLPKSERRLEDMPQLVRGLRDCDEDTERRRSRRNKMIIDTLRGVTSNIQGRLLVTWLNEFDDALEQTKGTRLRDVQRFSVISALESDQNLLQQVSTGEGKSFIISAIAAIRCKRGGATVDIISSSSVLAQRDATQLRDLYEALGLSVAHNCDESSKERKKAYIARIVYGDIAHFQRDYLLDTFHRKKIRGDRQLDEVIVDEVDSMTLDCGNHVLYISHKVPSLKLLDSLFVFIQRQIHSPHEGEAKTSEDIRIRTLRELYGRLSLKDLENIMPDQADAVFTSIVLAGFIDNEGLILTHKSEMLSDLRKALDPILDSESISVIVDTLRIEMEREKEIVLPVHMRAFVRLHISTFIENCVQASAMRPDVDYTIDKIRLADGSTEERVMIIEGDTGADLESTQWAGGLHQFLQMKHACRVTPMSLKAVFISNVTFLRKYNRLYGLSGTLGSAEESRILADLYKVDLIHIPTHKPRRMIEHVPILLNSVEEWSKTVYREVEREIDAHRSVLIICQTIEELKQLHNGLKTCHGKKKERSPAMDFAMTSITVFARQSEKFDYQERGLEQERIILSTNLAGRGTDILLSKGLEKNGGLHVIVAFVPRNQRVEDQAMGRAARCGAPGSGRVIAHIHSSSGTARAPNFQDFKMRRDNAEVLRIQSLQNHFQFRIAVEEDALKRFRNQLEHLEDKLFRERSDGLPEAEDVIYKALLDNWTLWLDANDRVFSECERAKDDRMADAIIQSVDDFLDAHRIEKANDNRLIVPKWIRAGEWLLRLAIIQMSHKEGAADAERTFHRVIEDGADTAAFAYYYLGCLAMDRFEEMRTVQSSLLLEAPSPFEANVDLAISMFARARVALTLLLERRSADTRFVQLLTGSSSAHCGLQHQLAELTTAVHQIIANIDWLIGEPMSADAFHPLSACPQQQAQLFESLTMIDAISPPLLGQDVQARAAFYGTLIQRKFGLGQQALMRILRDERVELLRPSDETKGVIDTIERRAVMHGEGSALAKRCHLPSRMDFWTGMHEIGAFYDMQHVYVVKEEAREEVANAIPIDAMVIDEETTPNSVMYSNRAPHDFTLYAKSAIDARGDSLVKKIRTLVERKKMELDLLARVDSTKIRKPYLPQFDGFTVRQLKENFGFDESTCSFVIDHLLTKGVIELDNEDEEVYRQAGPINCSTLPSALADSIDHFLGHHFAYTFDRGVLSTPGDDAQKVMLPVDAYQELFEELTRLEIISPPRILSNNYGLIDYTDFPFVEKRELWQFVHARRMKVKDRIQMFKLVPIVEYLSSRGAVANSEMEDLIELGMVAAVSLKKATTAHKIAGAVFRGCRFLGNKGLTSILFITGAVGIVMGAAVHSVGAAVVTAVEWSSKVVPGHVTKAIYSSVSKTVDAIEWVPEKINECLLWAGEKMMHGLSWVAGKCVNSMEFLGGKHFERVAEAAKSIGKGIQQSLFYMFAQCRALFGSAEYYNQCRVTAQKIATSSKLTKTESRKEFRIARVFHAIGAAVEEQEVQADSREQELIDQLCVVARNLKMSISSVLQLPRLSFPDIATFLDLLENMQWFETELDLCLQCAAMRGLRLLAATGSVESFQLTECNMKALKIAFSEVLKDCEDAKRQYIQERPHEKGGQKLKNIINDLIDLKTTEMFTNPLSSFIRCIMSEYFTCETSQPVQSLIKADVAKAMKDLRKHSSFTFLEKMQSKSLVSKVHETVFHLYEIYNNSTNSNAELIQLLRSLFSLTRSCLIHRLPMPCEPFLSVIFAVSDLIDRCAEIKIGIFQNNTAEKIIFLTEVDYPRWNAMFKPTECVFLFESFTDKPFENADRLREMLIQRLLEAVNELWSQNSVAFLEMMQSSLVMKVHGNLFRLNQILNNSTNSKEEYRLIRSLFTLTRTCLIHRLPMPYDPCLTVLCMVSDVIDQCSKIRIRRLQSNTVEKFILLTEVDYPRWNAMFKPSECIFLCEYITDKSFENSDIFRELLIERLLEVGNL